MLRKMIGLSIYEYNRKVLYIVLSVCVIAYILPLFILFHYKESFMRFALVLSSGSITSLVTIYFLGLSKSEQKFFIQIIRNVVKNKIHIRF